MNVFSLGLLRWRSSDFKLLICLNIWKFFLGRFRRSNRKGLTEILNILSTLGRVINDGTSNSFLYFWLFRRCSCSRWSSSQASSSSSDIGLRRGRFYPSLINNPKTHRRYSFVFLLFQSICEMIDFSFFLRCLSYLSWFLFILNLLSNFFIFIFT